MRAKMLGVGIATAACLGVTACAPGGVTIPPGFEELEPCPSQHYSVEELSRMENPGCDLAGSTIIAPDGSGHLIGDVGHVSVSSSYSAKLDQGPEYTVVNWGVPGATLTITEAGKPRTTWASSAEALKLQRKQLAH